LLRAFNLYRAKWESNRIWQNSIARTTKIITVVLLDLENSPFSDSEEHPGEYERVGPPTL